MKPSIVSSLCATFFGIAVLITACTQNPKSTGKDEPDVMEAVDIEHERDKHGGGEGEEEGIMLGLDEIYDEIRKETHLVLSYDTDHNAFVGTVENLSEKTLDRVRVEVHLSNGMELGPTTQVNLEPGEKREVKLATEQKDFDSWTTHAEVGSGEHGHSHEGEHGHSHEGEHGHSHEGEHNHDH